ncbi:MAG: metal-dependent transcriptional regulator [Clostridiales bacterium]|nr:metal-dependent transcriptional regulator [Clostridiales bacterium]
MAVTEAVENYLEAILVLSYRQPDVHAVDVCNYLGYSRPTLSVAIKQMRENGLITVSGENHIFLTESGKEVAEKIYERHNVIAAMLIQIGVSEEVAYADACKIEHDLSNETFAKLKEHYSKFKKAKGLS